MSVEPRLMSVPNLSLRPAARPRVAQWEVGYRNAVLLVDLVVIGISLRIGLALTDGSVWELRGALAVITTAVLLVCLFACAAWDKRVLGQGVEEFRRLGNATACGVVGLGLTGLALNDGYFRPWVFGVLPITGLILLATRYGLRRVLHARRTRGLCMHDVLITGSAEEAAHLIDRTRRETHQGWSAAAVCLTDAQDPPPEVHGVPVVGGPEDVPTLVEDGDYRVVAVVPGVHWTRQRLRALAWDLEGAPTELVVAPALMEFTGPRLHVAPVYGLTLLKVTQPTLSGARWMVKAAIDRAGALLGLLALAPTLLLIALAIKLEDGGPVLFGQQRVGKGGLLFSMWKFRSMAVDAERRRAELEVANEAAGPLFKLRDDPRVTRVGAVLRRFSLDELPQLLNVLVGHMSVVGPRPPLPAEVERYGDDDAHRRLLVRPGLTGLWQVSGRSELSWEETVRLDLRYVDNWSLAMDAVILWKTASAVVRGNGAY